MKNAKGEEMTPEEERAHRAAELRRSNENRNQSQLDRRNAIADEADGLRDSEFDDISDEGKIVARVRKTPEEIEQEAADEEARAAAERARIEAAGDDDGGPGNQDPHEDDDEGGAENETGDSKKINGVVHYLLIVNGKEKWLTLQQIRESASKVEAADEYLQNAAESARRAVALETTRGADTEEADTEVEEMLNKALLGDQESVKKLARHLKASPSRVTPDVMQAVDERLTFRDAVNWFETEFKPELADARLKEMIVREDVRLRDENPTMPYKQRLKTAGDNIRKWRNGITGSTGTGADARTNKQQRKQQMSSVVAAGGRQGGTQDEDAEEPVSAQIERIAAGRHQARAVKH